MKKYPVFYYLTQLTRGFSSGSVILLDKIKLDYKGVY